MSLKPHEDEPIATEVWVSDYQQKQKTHHSVKACKIIPGVTVEYLTTSNALLTEADMLRVKPNVSLNLVLLKLFFYLLPQKGIVK